MKAVRFHRFGGAEVMQYEDAELPRPGAGQVRVRVAATSFNDLDVRIREGRLQRCIPVQFPHIPGVDVAGTIDEIGQGAGGGECGLHVGDAVVGCLPASFDGASAEYVVAPAEVLTGAPKNTALTDVAALPLAGLTAWQALFDHGRLSAGQRVLVNGAGTAVGGYAVQLAKEARAHVIATASSLARVKVEAAGADAVIGSTDTGVPAAAVDPVDLVVNLSPLRTQELSRLLLLVADGGVLVNTAVRVPAPSDDSRRVRGVDVSVRNDSDQLADLVARVCTGELFLDVTRRVALADLPALHARAGTGQLLGKVVVLAP